MVGNSPTPTPTILYRVDDREFQIGLVIRADGCDGGRYYRGECLVDRTSKEGEITLKKGLLLFRDLKAAQAFQQETGGYIYKVAVASEDIIYSMGKNPNMEYAVCLNRVISVNGDIKSKITIDSKSQTLDSNIQCFAYKARVEDYIKENPTEY